MTALSFPARRAPAIGLGLAAAGIALLVLRPLLAEDGHPTATLVVLFVALLTLGAAWPVATDGADGSLPRTAVLGGVLAVGIAAFTLGRILGGGHSPTPPTLRVMLLNSLAAVAEEAFFRRLIFALLLPGGAFVAVGGSALVFALAHVTVYGWWVLPLDLAAGLVFGWQRLTGRTWGIPALTHVVANVLVVL